MNVSNCAYIKQRKKLLEIIERKYTNEGNSSSGHIYIYITHARRLNQKKEILVTVAT